MTARDFKPQNPARHSGFSLVEVVIAVGIFAVAVVGILGLLPSLARQAAESSDTIAAQRLPEPVHIELDRLAATAGFDSLAAAMPVMSTPLQDGFALVGARDGLRVLVANPGFSTGTSVMPQSERYFHIEAWRFDTAPLSYEPGAAVLALHVRVSWPYFNPGSTRATPLVDRNQFIFTVTLKR